MPNHGVIAYAFGLPDTIRSNQLIAHMATRKSGQTDAPMFTQTGVAIPPGVAVTYMTEAAPGSPTLRIARAAVVWARERRIDMLWIASAIPHTIRAMRDTELAIDEAGVRIRVRMCESPGECGANDWFCSDSTQPRTRSRSAWEKRERLLLKMPIWLYKRVAS